MLASLLDHGPVGGALRRFFIAFQGKRINKREGVVSENGKNRTLRERSAFREGATR